MKSITIHNLDDVLNELIRKKAKSEGLSLNKTIQNLLREALKMERQEKSNRRKCFLDLFNTWTEDDLKEFNNNTEDMDKINPADWE